MPELHDENRFKQLWDRYRASMPGRGRCLPVSQVAAYIDGTCSDDERDFIERHLAECTPCLEGIILLREVQVQESKAPRAIIEQGQAVWSRRNKEIRRAILHGNSWWQWGAIAAVYAGLCLVGFQLGAWAHETRSHIDRLVAEEVTFRLGEPIAGLHAEIERELRGEV